MGHYNGSNLGAEMLMEMFSLCFWFMKPKEPLSGGLKQGRWLPARTNLQRQWALVMQVRNLPASV